MTILNIEEKKESNFPIFLRTRSFLPVILLIIFALIQGGCGGNKKKEPLGLYLLKPVPVKNLGLKTKNKKLIFENKEVKVSLKQKLSAGNSKGSGFFAVLLKARFILVEMTIESKKKKKIIYNPIHTYLLAGSLDYKKPLDYPDLYMIASSVAGGSPPEAILNSIRGLYYDLNTNLKPGEKKTKYLIFRPFSEKNTKALIVMKEFYVGTDTLALTFPFEMIKAASHKREKK
ncbi:MAG: hypothetical protein KAT46_03965 [Deltaproteobacteria bacterium]|nr:hypothetical protein [Deltaproteobacteria bacterium]